MPPDPPDDTAEVRVSDAERQSVVDRLSRAVGVADLADSSSDLAFGDDRELHLAGIDRPVHARPASRRP